MMKPFQYFSVVFLLLFVLSTPLYAVDTNSAASTLPPGKHALILISGGYGVPARDIYISGLFELLNKRGFTRRDIHLEYLNLDRYTEVNDRKKLALMLKQRYADLDIDLVFCLLQPALNFLLHEIPEIAPKAPVLSWLASMPESAMTGSRQFVFQSVKLDYRGTLQRALELFPGTERVIVMQGNSEEEKARKEVLWNDLAPWQGKLKIEDTQALTAEEIETLLAAASKNTIIMGVGIVRDAKGEVFVPIEFIRRVLKSAKAPFFVLFDTNIGSGTIGGSVARVSEEAATLAALGADVISGRTALKGQITNLPSVSTPMFDWQQLQRWGAKTSTLPDGTVFVNRPVTLWSQHKKESVIALIVFLLLSTLTASLYFMNRRLKENEERYRLFTESVSVVPWEFNIPENRWTYVGPQVNKILGYTPDEWTTLEWWLECIHPEDRKWVPEYCSTLTARGENHSMEYRIMAKDGSFVWVNDIVTVEMQKGKPYKMRGLLIDITGSKQSEEELRQSREDQDRAQQVGQVGSWRLNTRKNELTWSDENHRIYGIPKGTPMTYETFLNVVHPDDRQYVDTMWQAGLRGEQYDIEHRLEVEGQVKWVREKAFLEFDETGKLLGGFGITQDITDRVQIQKTLQEQQNLLQNYLDNLPALFFVKDLTGKIITVNKTFERMFAITKDELIGKTDFDLHPEDEAALIFANDQMVAQTGEAVNFEEPAPLPDGEHIFLSTKFPIRDLNDRIIGTAGISFDITERKKAEEEKLALEQQFQHTQKLESLGVLAGGIAHDFNNILAIIMGNCSLASMDDENAGKYIPEIEKASERAAALCRQMLAYAGKASLTQSQVNTWTLVDEMVTMLRTTIKQNVLIKPDLATDIPSFTGDASQIRQVVMNLIINAAEAIGDVDGEVDVKLAKTEIKAEQPENRSLCPPPR